MKTMETIAGSSLDEHFDVPLDALFNYKSSSEKEMEHLSQDWTFLDDIDSEKYLQSPLGGDMLPVECVGMDDIQDSPLLGNLGDLGTMDTVTSADSIPSPSCKSCTSDTDSQYDSGIGESLSGEDSESSSVSGSSPSASNKSISPSLDRIDSVSDEGKDCVQPGEREDRGPVNREARRYNLRTSSVINRVETDHKKKQSPRQPKPKLRPPPLSKYRRKTANARERSRMTEINEAFTELQSVIPELPEGKLTKITTLRLAMNYITALRELLASGEDGGRDEEPQRNGNSGSLDQSQAGPVLGHAVR